ncbi:MAG: AEC family transporter [Butyrivibrio sp.]|jgi:predicted permease|nr:AEC family transporter [Butyrivibrio sp.]
MSILTVIEQMIVICLLILIGVVLYRKGQLRDLTVQQISALIVNVTNPALLLSSAFSAVGKVPAGKVVQGILLFTVCYGAAYLIGMLIPFLLRAERSDHYAYQMMTVYGNVGFIGIPLALAVLGNDSLIYVSMNNLVYNIFFYTSGIMVLRKRAEQEKSGREASAFHYSLPDFIKKIVNIGTVSAVLTIMVYLLNPEIPSVISDTLRYAGNATTLLSMLVLGASVAVVPLRNIFTDLRIYLFTALRMVVMPVLLILLLRPLIRDQMLMEVTALLLAVPAGNLPMIVSRELGLKDELFSKGIIVTTILSPVTITLVMLLTGTG